jgi:hypothetical protein
LPAPHSASARHTCTEPVAHEASQLVVVAPIMPPPPPPVRQQTCPELQLALLEHATVVVVPVGQAATLAAQLELLPMPIAPGTVQHVRSGAMQ